MSKRAEAQPVERPEGFDTWMKTDGGILAAVSKSSQVYMVTPSPDCHCLGRGTEDVTAKSLGGESKRLTRPCRCVWDAVTREELIKHGSAAPNAPLTGVKKTRDEEAAVMRLADEVERLESVLRDLVAKRNAAVAVHETERDLAAAACQDTVEAMEETELRGQCLADALVAAEDEIAILRETQENLRSLLDEEGALYRAQETALADLRGVCAAAAARVNEVANRNGVRHRIDVQRKRVEKLRGRLDAKLRDLGIDAKDLGNDDDIEDAPTVVVAPPGTQIEDPEALSPEQARQALADRIAHYQGTSSETAP